MIMLSSSTIRFAKNFSSRNVKYMQVFSSRMISSSLSISRGFCLCQCKTSFSSNAIRPNNSAIMFTKSFSKSKLISVPIRYYTNRNILALRERGLISNIFPPQESDFKNLCIGKPQAVYAGFDPTADSLHVGNLAVLMLLMQCQRAGHTPIALIGGATGLIGDPSGKNHERPLLEKEFVEQNTKKLASNISSLFHNHAKLFWDDKDGKEKLPPCIIVNNKDWYKELNTLDFFRDLGRHFRIGDMIVRTAVQSRLKSDEGISYTEFSYQVFQSYDWYHLLQKYDCTIQIGGHDQMGNIVSGHDFIKRSLKKKAFGLTVPLITSETGDKYGKSAGNAMWLDATKTSPFEMFQFFVRTFDSDVERLLKIFTFRSDDEIAGIMRKHLEKPEERHAQLMLACDVVRLVHADKGLETAKTTTKALYSEDVDALGSIPPSDVNKVFKGTSAAFSEIYLEPGTTVLSMAVKAKCFSSEKDAMRIIDQGGFYLNYRRITNFNEMIVPGIHILPNKISLARVGKKNYYVIKWNP